MQESSTKQFLFSQTIADKYKEVSEVINTVEPKISNVRRVKSIKAMMQESFFHGANWAGCNNFIA